MARMIDTQILIEEIQSSLDIPSYSEHDKGFDDGLKYVLGLIEKAPTLTPPNEWVSVEERLPEDNVPAGRKQITVLVCSKAEKVSAASRIYEPEKEYNGKVYPARWRWSKLMNNYVTHWMPLPAPPDCRPPERGGHMITHITVEDAAKLISRLTNANETQALTYIREAADRGEIQAADAHEKLQAENEKLRVELEQVKQKYDEAREAICTHCMDFPCRGESCYWWRGQKGG